MSPCLRLRPSFPQLLPPSQQEQQIQQGRRSYRDGQYSEAVQILQQSAQSAETASRAIALSNLALAHLKLGQYPEAEDAVAQAAAIVKTLAANDYTRRLQAQVFSTQAQIQMSKAQLESALAALAQAEVAYQAIADTPGLIRTWLNQAQILRVQGRYRQSLSQLRRAGDALDNLPDSALKAAGLRQLGNLQRLVETVEASLPVLEESLRVAEGIGSATEVSATLLSLGNAKAAQQTWAIAIDHYQQAAIAAPSVSPRLQAQINHLQILLEQPNFDGYRGETVLSLSAKIQAQLPELPLSRSSVLMQASLGQSLIDAKASPWSELKIAQLLAKTSTQAQDLEDGRGQSYALGYLGRLYQKKQQWSDAAATTQQALTLAQGISADSIAYQWQWQLGQILRQQGHTQAAIAAYQQAISTLQSLRSSLVAVNPEVRYSFRAGVEPIYRELVDLLLQPLAGEASEQKNLLDARDAIESLQVAELVNFFRADCLVTNPVQIDQVDAQAAVIYPIILPDRLEVVVRLPGQEALQHQSVAVSQTKIEETLDALRTRSQIIQASRSYQRQSRHLKFLKPLENLRQQQIRVALLLSLTQVMNQPQIQPKSTISASPSRSISG
ncbi:MAG: tetratricopeptide repeat protein [Leptolyngbyaceae cyanobacterium SM1_1_3]|nr:tetratricopeptide repeat protein [Leptolyngbyaceae cyanobacterium SM1_1_3]